METIQLDYSLGVANVEELKQQLSTILREDNTGVTIDASEVDKVDTSTLQLLAAFARAMKSNGKSFEIVRPSCTFDLMVKRIGLAHHLSKVLGGAHA